MAVGYYCTVMRDATPRRKVGWLLGPYDQVNDAHRRKATTLPATYADLFAALETGICAAVDGSAFDLADA